jgi:hypothetical protein
MGCNAVQDNQIFGQASHICKVVALLLTRRILQFYQKHIQGKSSTKMAKPDSERNVSELNVVELRQAMV